MKQLKHFFIICLCIMSYGKVAAQFVEGTPCTASCLDPLKGTISGTLPNANNQSPNLNLPCGGGTSEDNPVWFIIRPSKDSLTFSFTATNCVGGCGAGIEMTLWEGDNCGSVTAVNCISGASGKLTSKVTPCKVYYLQLDGLCESRCFVTLNYDNSQILREVPAPVINGPKQVCKTVAAKFCAALPSLNGCQPDSYKWTLDPASSGTITKIVGDPDCVNIKFTNPPANGKVKVLAEPVFVGKCPPKTNKAGFDVEILELKPATCDVNLCPEERPVIYELIKCVKTTNPTFTDSIFPAFYTINFPPGTKKSQKISYTVDGNNCLGEVTLNINVFDNKPVQLPPLIFCTGEEKTVKGVKFDCADSGSAPKKFVQEGNPKPIRCDTAFEMLIQCIKISPKVSGAGTLDCATKQLVLDASQTITLPNSIFLTSYTGEGKREYTWSKNGVLILGATNASLTVTEAGLYEVAITYTYEVSQVIGGKLGKWSNRCTNTIATQIEDQGNNVVAETPIVASLSCKSDTSSYYINPASTASYEWSIIGQATILGLNTGAKVYVKDNGTPYQVCVKKKACGLEDTKCIAITPQKIIAALQNNHPKCIGDELLLRASGGASYTWKGPNGLTVNSDSIKLNNIDIVNNGKYEVTVTDLNGCSTVLTTLVNIEPKANIVVSSNSPLCPNETLTFLTLGGATYAWSGPNGFTSNQQNPSIPKVGFANEGVYSVIATSSNGCTTEEKTTVKIFPLPQVAATCNTPVCKGATVNFLALGGTTYNWTGPDGFQSALQNPILANVESKNAGTYTVTVTDGVNCTNTASTILVVENCIATKDILAKAAIQLFPNPIKDQLTIHANLPIVKVVLSNSIGQEMLSQKIDNETITLKTENLPKGVYFAKVYLDEKTFEVFSVVKE
jgi:hypothetical protein